MNDDEIKNEFAYRQQCQRKLSYSALGAVLLLLLAVCLPGAVRTFVFALVIFYAALIVFATSRNWRCPVCGKLLGMHIEIDECPHCKTKLK